MNLQIKISTKGALLSGKAPQVIQAGLDSFVTEAVNFLDGQVKARTPQGVLGGQGGVISSIQTPPITGKGTPMVKGSVVSAHSYAAVIEKGRRPGKGMPPKGMLVRWIETKLGLSETEARKVEFVIRRSIGITGFKGRHMFEKAATENQSVLDAMAGRYGLTIARELSE